MVAVASMAFFVALLSLAAARKSGDESDFRAAANPIRKVVNLMEKMSEKIEKQEDEEKELYEKFMCHCKSELADFEKGKDAFEAEVPKLQAEIESKTAEINSLTQEIEVQRSDEKQVQQDLATAIIQRSKEHGQFEKEYNVLEEEIHAVDQGVAALDAAMGNTSALLQESDSSSLNTKVLAHLSAAQISSLQRATDRSTRIGEAQRQTLAAFIAGAATNSGIGEVKGILETQRDNFQEEEDVETEEENKSVNIFQELMSAKTTEDESLNETIAEKLDRLGNAKVALVEVKGELKAAQNALGKDFSALKKLKEVCDKKTEEWDERQKMVAEELLAIKDTIKTLSSDQNLDLFRKALSFVQLEHRADEVKSKALSVLRTYAESQGQGAVGSRAPLDLVMLELQRKGVDFTSVMKMIDDMIALMKKEQKDDDAKKEFCGKKAQENELKTKALRHRIKTLESAVAEQTGSVEAVTVEIKDIQEGIATLDKAVAESTEIRKNEHEEYQKVIQEQTATKEVLMVAKDRMNQFYHPELVKQAPSLMQVNEHKQLASEAPEVPEFGKTKTQEGNVVINMIGSLITDTDKTVAKAEFDEKESQKLYEEMLADSKAKREADMEAIVGKQKVKAEAESEKVAKAASAKSETAELKEVEKYGKDLSEDCSFLEKNYALRKEMRSQEEETLVSAKGVLAGAK
eukprot:TRINITY_DN51768_c0_g1_i1.p1 TRINITY_DN51768_c0_g1~~TRINITY_DN51768_c0_g1_i1.p1  ORF type:complete len:704 (+),score=267.43 TRINITY_DN51768_c0_g1_i1:48-2114(+)